MISKKAQTMLGEHTVETVVAVLSIAVLIFLGVSIGNFYLKQDKELTHAKNTLDTIFERIDSLEEGQTSELILLNPEKWVLIPWSSLEGLEACDEKNCLCICDYSSGIVDISKLKGICNNPKKASCSSSEKEIIGEFIKIESPSELGISLINDKIKIEII